MKPRRRIRCIALRGSPNLLRRHRAFLGLRQTDLAAAIGCSAALISKIEKGVLTPRPVTAVLLARAVGRMTVEVFPELQLGSDVQTENESAPRDEIHHSGAPDRGRSERD